MGLWLKQVCVFGKHFYTHTPLCVCVCACTQMDMSVSYVAVLFELIQYHAEVNGRWVKPTSLLMGAPICMSMSLF